MKHNGPGRADNGNFALSDIRVFVEPLEVVASGWK
ncbi:MAG: hypothetical protein CM1200mP29_09290 [Verrucomicrobiota bacterium]|nr:MAG: hypothetical protein CM1200mP29_09290 [Verrucomicrobiota bacterium]